MASLNQPDYASDWEKLPVPKTTQKQDVAAYAKANEAGIIQNALKTSPFSKEKIAAQFDTLGSDLGAGVVNAVTGIGSSIIGGWRGISELAKGNSLEDAAKAVQEEQQNRTYQPTSEGGQKVVAALTSPANPMNWIGVGAKKAGELAQDAGASPALATGIETGINAAALGLLKGQGSKAVTMPKLVGGMAEKPAALPAQAGGVPVPPPSISDLNIAPSVRQKMAANAPAVAAPVAAPAVAPSVKVPNLSLVADTEPVKGGVPLPQQTENAAVLARIGLEKARESAVKGDALNAATDYQVSKFNQEPAGKAAVEQFAAENAALKGHAANIIKETGGTVGMDEGALAARGQAIAAPLDALKTYFDKATKTLYAEADKRSNGAPAIQPEGFGKLLNQESAFAGKSANQSLGGGIKSYLKEQGIMDKEGNLRQITAQEAEGIKQYINSQYSYETSGLAGKIKGALDKDVFKSAGEDVYAAARALYRKRMQTLDNPKGVAKIMEYDPQNPMNRATAFEKIPETIIRLSKSQYDHLLETLRGMPEELQPQAQAAIKEIQAHWGEKLLQKGTGLTPDAQWNAPRVTELIRNNSEKIHNAFADSPELLGKIEDLQKAGNILRVNAGYPGAAAQAANAVKRGVMSNILRPIGASTGGLAGSLLGPAGTAAGAWAGELAGARAAQSIGESGALKRWNKAMVNLKDVQP